ncbi:hypothetical protein ACFQ7F_07385 [Streptomyces sp. NPDC056486]|uniref:hypothetical protein n=1 Tax=Streptomyces sp. NPDC056486 TaxID=3345835 RepID=UPI0036C03451
MTRPGRGRSSSGGHDGSRCADCTDSPSTGRPARGKPAGSGEIRAVVRLLEWLPEQGSSLAACTQDQIDAYLATGPADPLQVRSFLHWTSRHQHTRALTAPFHTSSFAADIVAAYTRWRLVHDGTALRLRLGTHPVEIPPPLDSMLRELLHHPIGKAHRLEPGPAFVFSRQLGFSEQTAANWTAESGGDDTPYAAHRARRAGSARPAPLTSPRL